MHECLYIVFFNIYLGFVLQRCGRLLFSYRYSPCVRDIGYDNSEVTAVSIAYRVICIYFFQTNQLFSLFRIINTVI